MIQAVVEPTRRFAVLSNPVTNAEFAATLGADYLMLGAQHRLLQLDGASVDIQLLLRLRSEQNPRVPSPISAIAYQQQPTGL